MRKIPDKWLGEEIKGSLERVLKEPQSNIVRPRNTNPIIVPNIDGYIYVPSTNLLVAKQRTHLGESWDKARNSLKQEGSFMMNLYEFAEFLRYLKTNPNQENSTIYEDITAVRNPYRAEWLDAKFSENVGKMFVDYDKSINGKRESLHETLKGYLDKNRTPGIDLEKWIDNHTIQGFPRERIKKGDLYYWAPVDGRVARFGAYSDGADLSCDGGPTGSYSRLGVRAAREKK